MHYISTNTNGFYRIGNIYNILDLIKEAGFSAYDFSMLNRNSEYKHLTLIDLDNYIQEAIKLRQYADSIGLVCNQAHAPFPCICPDDNLKNIDRFEAVKRSIEVAGILGAKIIVVHPFNDYSSEQNKKWYMKLLPLAKKNNIKLAYENMWNWSKDSSSAIFAACSTCEDFNKHIKDINDENVVACVDVGHASMMGDLVNPYDLIISLNKFVQALHIHDCDLHFDRHELPFTMNVDFNSIVKALREINYQGDITLECDNYFDKRPEQDSKKLARDMFDAAKKIYDFIFLN